MKNSIREARSARQLTQQQLAEQVQVSRQTIISIENGRYLPSALLAIKLARALGKRVEDVFVLEEGD